MLIIFTKGIRFYPLSENSQTPAELSKKNLSNCRILQWDFIELQKISKGNLKNFKTSERKNGVFWDVTPCGSCKNRRFGGI
jgi:hypothetical protein